MDSIPEISCHIEKDAFWRPPVDVSARSVPIWVGETWVPFRTCSWCGSMHPEDMVAAIRDGAHLSGSDWKYGWPHKHQAHDGFYLRVRNSDPTRERWSGRRNNGDGTAEDIYEPFGAWLHAKFYNVHLQDLSKDQFDLVAPVLATASGIHWYRNDASGVSYVAPHRGFQKS